MPELPEVETVASQLAPLIVGQTIDEVHIVDDKLDFCGLAQLCQKRIVNVYRLGKQVVFDLAGGRRKEPDLHLGVHLRMTGRLFYHPLEAPLPHHVRSWFRLTRGKLVFSDVRRFGTMRVEQTRNAFAPLGIDPTSDQFSVPRLRKLLSEAAQEIKVWLLRQDRLVGLGNIYASEILFAARIHPRRIARSLSRDEIRRLHRQTKRVLKRAIACAGTTFSDFQDTKGQSGGFARFLKVYGREHEPCRCCRHPLERITQQGRATFFCPVCQSGDESL